MTPYPFLSAGRGLRQAMEVSAPAAAQGSEIGRSGAEAGCSALSTFASPSHRLAGPGPAGIGRKGVTAGLLPQIIREPSAARFREPSAARFRG